MKKTAFRIISIALILVMMVTVFSSCDIVTFFKGNNEIPNTVMLKTDLKDPSYTFTYGELKKAIPLEKLADLFESYDEKSPETEIVLTYNDITTRFNADVMKDDGKTLAAVWALCTPEEIAATTANKDLIVDYFNTLINNAKAQKPITEFDESFWTDDSSDTIMFSKDGKAVDNKTNEYNSLRAASIIFKNYVLDGAKGSLLGHKKDSNGKTIKKTEKGDDLTDILYLFGSDKASLLTSADVESAASSVKAETTVIDEVEYITGYTRTIAITLKENDESVLKAFSMHDKAPVLDELKKAKDYFTVDDYSTKFNACTIFVAINAVTDEITDITYQKNMTVNSSFTGANDYSSLGKVDIQFNCTNQMYYKFGWHSSDEVFDSTTKGFYKYHYYNDMKKAFSSADSYKETVAADKDKIAEYFSGCAFDPSIVTDKDYLYVSEDNSVVYFYDTDSNSLYYIHK